MKLSNIESRKLLPRFASKIAWLMDALDSIIKPISERVKSIDAPLTLEAIAALTDEELEALYDQYGVAQYYPELSRSTRDLMLYEMCKIYRCLGTPHAIELLCNYIFDNVPLNVHVLDNLAFDEQGTLIDASLLDVFDIEVNPELPVLSEDATARLIANIIRFSRNSQALRDIIYTFTEDFELPVYPLRAGVPGISVENDAICTLLPMTFVVVDSTTGKVVSGCNQELTTYELPSVVLNSEDGYATYELPSVSLPTPNVVIGVHIDGPVQAFWFTDEGRSETNDKTFTVVGNPLFDEDGSIARNELYELAVPLSFMQYDGNMFEADSDSDTVRYLPTTSRLTLSIPGDSTTRDKSAWSVQCAKLFVLSYANTQLPDVQIELPINEVGGYGTVITLPTIDGEYESGGKTWKPSAWDIGAFGSSYSLTADTVAHLIFEEVQQYQEITLYMASGRKDAQSDISSGFSGNVDPTYVYPLYYDSGLTDPFAYDYSKDYEVGYYSSSTGEWVRYAVQAVSDMPSSGSAVGRILLDTGDLWLITNAASATMTSTSITVRIYPKGQQHYPLYFSQNGSIYNNYSTSGGTSNGMQHRPGNISYGWMPWSNSFPERTIVNALYSSGKSGVSISRLSFDGTDEMRIRLASGYSPSFRNVIFTLDVPTYTSWANLSGNKSAESNEVCPLLDKNGEYVVYDSTMSYTIIGLFNYSGGHPFSSPNKFMFDAQLGAFDTNNPTRLCFKLNRAVTFSYVWYIKEVINPIETTFGAAVTIPAGYHVESVKCQRLYVKASTVTHGMFDQNVSFVFDGENQYCDLNDTALLGAGVTPCLTMFAIASDPGGGYWITHRPMSSTVNPTVSLSNKRLNSGGVFVSAAALVSGATSNADTIANALNAYPALFRYYDSDNTIVPYYFKIQQSVWQFQNGAFSWLGDTTDSTDLAYWYNGRAVQITLAKDE